jgi:signal transduction histidine kinase
MLRDIPIKQKLRRVIILIWSLVLIVTCIGFFAYELYIFRSSTQEKLSSIGGMTAANSTAALAFSNKDDAAEVLSALKYEPHIQQAALYDNEGKLFVTFPATSPATDFPARPTLANYHYSKGYFVGSQPVKLDNNNLGFLYLKYDLNGLYYRLAVFGIVALVVTALSWWLAFLLSRNLQQIISTPVLALASTAKNITDQRDYSVRATKYGNDELGILTDSFNTMLSEAEQFQHHLEEKVRERTAQLQTINNELESFSYSVSHDLRAPLRAVNGYATMLKEDYADKIDGEGNRYLSTIIHNAGRMGVLIDDLLAISRTGRKEVSMQHVDMVSLVNSCLYEMKESVALQKYKISIDELPPCEGDHALLKQVWMNLISNAIKYSSKRDRPEIHIGCSSTVDEQIYCIKDNGVGFDMKYLHKLFGVFQRLHSDVEFEGTGIGIALVQRIISKHDGRVWAEGAVEKGATVYFSIPINK